MIEELLEHPLLGLVTLLENKLVILLIVEVPHLRHVHKVVGILVLLGHFHSRLEPYQIGPTLIELLIGCVSVGVRARRLCLEDWLVVFVNTDKLLLDIVVVRFVDILEPVQVLEYVFDLLQVLSFLPKFLLRVLEALSFDAFDLVHGVLLDFSPDQFFLEEVKNDEVETPQVVSPRQVDVIVSIEACERDSASKVSLLPLPYRVFVRVKMLLCQTEVHYKNLLEVLAQNEVGGFDVSVNKIPIMHLLDGFQHFYQQLHCYLEAVVDLENLPDFG